MFSYLFANGLSETKRDHLVIALRNAGFSASRETETLKTNATGNGVNLVFGSSHWRAFDRRPRQSYAVYAGNVGQVYLGFNKTIANQIFEEYSSDSCNGYGRVSGEEVTLFCDGEPIREQVATCPHI